MVVIEGRKYCRVSDIIAHYYNENVICGFNYKMSCLRREISLKVIFEKSIFTTVIFAIILVTMNEHKYYFLMLVFFRDLEWVTSRHCLKQ